MVKSILISSNLISWKLLNNLWVIIIPNLTNTTDCDLCEWLFMTIRTYKFLSSSNWRIIHETYTLYYIILTAHSLSFLYIFTEVFFTSYLVAVCFYSLPIFIIQTFLGQFSSSGAISAFRVSPIFKGKPETIYF